MDPVMPPLDDDDVFSAPHAPVAGVSDEQVANLRLPQYSMESESSVLGGLLLDNNAWDRVGDLLVEADFYRHEHRLIFATISKLINDSKPADVITVFEHLQGMGKAAEVGGLAYLNQLAQYVPSATNIRRYAEIVRERAILRKLLTVSDEIATQAQNPQGKPVERIFRMTSRWSSSSGRTIRPRLRATMTTSISCTSRGRIISVWPAARRRAPGALPCIRSSTTSTHGRIWRTATGTITR